jgi:hypothetical protein
VYLLAVREVLHDSQYYSHLPSRYRFSNLSGPIHVDAIVLHQLPAYGELSDLDSQRYTVPTKTFITTDAIQYNRNAASLLYLQASKDRRFLVLLFAELHRHITQHRHSVAVNNYPILPCCTYCVLCTFGSHAWS